MRLPYDIWAGVLIGRLSFGFVGQLTHVQSCTNGIRLRLVNLRLTEDTFDRAKLALGNVQSLSQLLPEGNRPIYLAGETKTGQVRYAFLSDPFCDYKISTEANTASLDKILHGSMRDIEVLRGVVVLDTLAISALYHEMSPNWRAFLFEGDKEWEAREALSAESSTMSPQTRLILKMTLCPQRS